MSTEETRLRIQSGRGSTEERRAGAGNPSTMGRAAWLAGARALFWDNPALEREWSLRRRRRRANARDEAAAWLALLLLIAGYFIAAWWLSRPERDPWEARYSLLEACLLYLVLLTALL